MLVFISYLASLYAPLTRSLYTASTLAGARRNADRVLEILDTPPDVKDAPDAREVRLARALFATRR